ncbi:hypothetical protein PR048_025880 [Dryococelus australis]|uniref:Uncharacterized protein n=1 Tax=Dryococelus australis TaxID=614101 RepID=A0ABQ9GJR5_9NEOP|nr:hypothetical protein PR048_025880 [Dryococelus australis]
MLSSRLGGRGGVVAILLVSHLGELGSFPGGVSSRFIPPLRSGFYPAALTTKPRLTRNMCNSHENHRQAQGRQTFAFKLAYRHGADTVELSIQLSDVTLRLPPACLRGREAREQKLFKVGEADALPSLHYVGGESIREMTHRPDPNLRYCIVRHDTHMRKTGVTRPGIDPGSPWWEASWLIAQPPLPSTFACRRRNAYVSALSLRCKASSLSAWFVRVERDTRQATSAVQLVEANLGGSIGCLNTWLGYSPSTWGNRVQFPTRSLPDFACGNRAGRCRWLASFLGALPFPLLFHSGVAIYSPRFTLISSQGHDVKSRPNCFTHMKREK